MALVRPPLGYMAKLLMIPDSLKSVIDDKKRIIGHLISAQIPDREGDVLIAKGGRFDTFPSSNPVVFLNHQNRELPVARSIGVSPTEADVPAVTQFAGLDQLHMLAETTYRLYRDKFMHSWSVGFLANPEDVSRDPVMDGQKGRTIKSWELLEYSAVGIPSNPAAKSALVHTLITKGICVLPDGATDRDLGEALGTIPLAKYWDLALPVLDTG